MYIKEFAKVKIGLNHQNSIAFKFWCAVSLAISNPAPGLSQPPPAGTSQPPPAAANQAQLDPSAIIAAYKERHQYYDNRKLQSVPDSCPAPIPTSGTKMVVGRLSTSMANKVYSFSMTSKSSSQEMNTWFREAFKQQGFKLERDSNDKLLAAFRGRVFCRVNFIPGKHGCSFDITVIEPGQK